MLVLSRKVGEVITIGNSIKITVISYDRGVVRLGIEAPKSIPVHRKEVHDKIVETNKESANIEFDLLKEVLKNADIKLKDSNKNTLEIEATLNTKKD